jgi:hypothetical protein
MARVIPRGLEYDGAGLDRCDPDGGSYSARDEAEAEAREDARMADLPHPAQRAVHATNNALQLLHAARDLSASIDQCEAIDRAIQLLGTVLPDVAVLQQLTESLEARVADLLETGLANGLYIQRLEDKNTGLNQQLIEQNHRLAAASKDVELLYITTSLDMERKITAFRNVVGLRQILDPSVSTIGERGDYVIINEPRPAAGAR